MPAAQEPDPATKELVRESVRTALGNRYGDVKWLGNGATGYVLGLRELSLGHARAIKVLRPDIPDVVEGSTRRSYADYFASEIKYLASLTHENVVQIYERGSLSLRTPDVGSEVSVPFYIMEFIEGDSLDDYLVRRSETLTAREVLDLIVQFGAGLAAIHEADVIHGDIKPANIRVTKRGQVKITDFGFAKSLERHGSSGSLWCQDKRYLHPELKARLLLSRISQPEEYGRTIIPVTDIELRTKGKIWEMHSIGETIWEIVYSVEAAGARRNFFRERDRGFLMATIARLKDPREQGPWDSLPRIDSYENAVQLARDLYKLATPRDLGGNAQELRANYQRTVRVPLADPIPLTDRLQSIIDHPLFQRLASVSQLGVVNLVFRSAKHTRFEHSLGVLATTIQYLRALWSSKTGSYFRQIVCPEDCEAVLLAAVLHDLGQYPFAHAFEESEITSRALFSHVDLTRRLLRARRPEDLGIDWHATLFQTDEDRNQIDRLLKDSKNRLLRDIIEGSGKDEWKVNLEDVLYLLGDEVKPSRPALKILRRLIDGPIDADKVDYLRRDALHLGMVVETDPVELLKFLTVVPLEREDQFDIALEEEGVSVAQDLHYARYRMFVNVYWEKVVRSAERMLRFAVDGLRQHLGEDRFRRIFFVQILTSSDIDLVSRLRREAESAARAGDGNHSRSLEGIAEILRNIESRRLHYEAFVLDARVNPVLHSKLSHFWEHALRDVAANAEFARFTERLLDLLREGTGKELQSHQVLLDIPDPKTDQPGKYAVWLRSKDGSRKAIDEFSPIWKEFSEMFRMHGRRIRVYAVREFTKSLAAVNTAKCIDDALFMTPAKYLQKPN
jgi:HD superfamily phosphohydrolase